jgi:exopolyphosphatase/guanosine-5'-triphosphate,3'-diphosphate pyrophosphatase
LLGFDQSELSLIAEIVRYHMKRIPTRKELVETKLDKRQQKCVWVLSAFLRIAENLDRSHLGRVKSVEFTGNNNKTTMTLYADENIDVELWGIESIQECFKTVFGKRLKVDVLPTQLTE